MCLALVHCSVHGDKRYHISFYPYSLNGCVCLNHARSIVQKWPCAVRAARAKFGATLTLGVHSCPKLANHNCLTTSPMLVNMAL